MVKVAKKVNSDKYFEKKGVFTFPKSSQEVIEK
jgi:hypothetical protein